MRSDRVAHLDRTVIDLVGIVVGTAVDWELRVLVPADRTAVVEEGNPDLADHIVVLVVGTAVVDCEY